MEAGISSSAPKTSTSKHFPRASSSISEASLCSLASSQSSHKRSQCFIEASLSCKKPCSELRSPRSTCSLVSSRDSHSCSTSLSQKACGKGQERKSQTLLALSRYCQEKWVLSMIKLHLTRCDKLTLTLLSGDAGCGKSHAVSMLWESLGKIGVSCHVSAITNRAAATLMESTMCDAVTTFHRLMGYKKGLINNTLSTNAFIDTYREMYEQHIFKFKQLREQRLEPQCLDHRRRHECLRFTPESCAQCSRDFKKKARENSKSSWSSLSEAPPFLGVNVLVVDEYGMLSEQDLEKMLACIALFYGPKKGPLIVFSGSVSQLQPAGGGKPIWKHGGLFEKNLALSTPLFVNRRQFQDPSYSEVLTYLQFNTVTKESRRILSSRCNITMEDVLNPHFSPESLRIFHSNDLQARYSTQFMTAMESKLGATAVAPVHLSWSRVPGRNTSRHSHFDALKHAAQVTPKLFSTPPWKNNLRPSEIDYLRVCKLCQGCRVGLMWHAGPNGIVAKEQAACFVDTEGKVVGIKYNKMKRWHEFTVKGLQSGSKYVVSPTTMNYLGWSLCTHPISCLLAMNTYDCQGSTVSGDVLYHPPIQFELSNIKPSVYVALSRVVTREKIRMTNCSFVDHKLYPPDLVEYRKRVEMAYV